jgi:N6-adenosine-specific RNA methylase IME4
MTETRPVAAIKIGERHRKEYGDLDALARSINDRGGLIHPIAITPLDELIAGERRLLAWQNPECRFRDEPIPATVIDIDSIVAGEADENDPALRKAFTPSEAVAIARALRPRLEALAKARQKHHGGTAPGRRASDPNFGKAALVPATTGLDATPSEHCAQIAQSVPAAGGRALAKIAKATGKSARTIEKAEAIVIAAEREPERYGPLVEAMDRTGRVNGPFKRLQNSVAAEAIRKEVPPLPMNGPYRAGSIDPPWASEPDDSEKDHGARGYFPYPTMTPEQIAELPVPSILHDDASVFLWITNFHLLRGDHLGIARAWGLRPVALLTWIKRRWGQGQRARGASEHLIQMVRGNVLCLGSDVKTWFEGSVGAHSQKPQEVYAIIEKLAPAPRYFELFSRGAPREGWELHGNEVGKLAAEILPSQTSLALDDDAPIELPAFLERRDAAAASNG